MANEALSDGETLNIVKEPEDVEEEVLKAVLTRGHDGEPLSEEEIEELF